MHSKIQHIQVNKIKIKFVKKDEVQPEIKAILCDASNNAIIRLQQAGR